MNRKLGSCNGTAVVQPPGSVCGECSRDDNCEQGLSDQAAYVLSALDKYEELSHAHPIGGLIVYELLDQPHLFPGSEALYGMVVSPPVHPQPSLADLKRRILV